MRKINVVYSVLFVTTIAVCVSCASGPDRKKPEAVDTTDTVTSAATPTTGRPDQSVNYSSLSSEQEGFKLTVTGLFSKGANGSASLITNPESRSRVTFVLADPEGVLAAAAPADGSVITVTGVLTDASKTWRKHLDVIALR